MPVKHYLLCRLQPSPDRCVCLAAQHEDVVQPQLLPPPFAGQPAVVLKHAHFSWGDGEGDRGCTLQDIDLKVRFMSCVIR